jgi:cytochrome c-type biogenesis protein
LEKDTSAIDANDTTADKAGGGRKKPGLWFYCGLFLGAIAMVFLSGRLSPLYGSLVELVSSIENPYQQWLETQDTANPLVLLPLALGGGLIASISPCILSLLPVNLSYIGTLNITSRRDALMKAGGFVAGAITVFSLLGLFASFAAAVLVDYRGYINILVGALILVMGLSFAGVVSIPLPRHNISLPLAGPYGVGLTFALVISPCSSSVLFAVIAAAAATNSIVLSTLTMIAYGLGYTAVIFFASLFTGLIKLSRFFLYRSQWVTRFGGAALILAGIYYLISGFAWFF